MIYLRDGISLFNRHIAGGGGVELRVYGEAYAAAEAELRRARRFEYPLAVMAFTPILDRSWRNMLAKLWNEERGRVPGTRTPEGERLQALALMLHAELRETDLITYDARHLAFNVICVQSTADQALIAARRVEQAYRQAMNRPLLYGAVEFPRHGLTIGSLLDEARAACYSPTHVVTPALEERSVG